MTTTTNVQPERWAGVASRVGLALAAVMSAFNVINGVGSLIDPAFGQTDPSLEPQPVFISVTLLVLGAVTLAALVPAWRGNRAALWTVVISRVAEAWSALVLPFLPGAPEGIVGFAVGLVVAGTLVAGLVALGLRRSP